MPPHLKSRSARTLALLMAISWTSAIAESTTPNGQDAADGSSVFKIFLEEPGVYRVTFEDLRAAGLEQDAVDSARLALSQGGRDVAIWVADGDDGRFEPGDQIEFIGERLAGHRSHYNEYTAYNVYRLDIDRPDGRRMVAPTPPDEIPRSTGPMPVRIREHLETDTFLLRFQDPPDDAPEPWYWQRLTHIDPEPFQETVWVRKYLPHPQLPTTLRVHLQGWSTAGGTLPDHRVDVYFNGERVGFDEWDGEEARLIEISEVPPDLVRLGENQVEVKVPRRRLEAATDLADDSDDLVIDEVILNWIELQYPRRARIDTEQIRFTPLDPESEAPIRLTTALETDLVVYSSDGSRYGSDSIVAQDSPRATRHFFRPPQAAAELYAVGSDQLETPLVVERERASSLRDPERQADYIIITHPKLEQAIEPLAAYHRQRGLEVTVVRVDEIYDQFNHSILDPHAIRDFLSHAYHHWQRPAPRFVLLVGDASWAGRSGGSSYGLTAEQLPEKEKSQRNLIPAGLYEGDDGPSASDNFYVTVDGDDHLPEMAIGRFPVTEPEEVTAIVEKTLSYASSAGVGPWRRSMLWIADDNKFFQLHTDRMAETVAERGFVPRKVYPPTEKEAHRGHQEILRQAFDQGQVLVHYLGHGGRFIWRTGQPNFVDNEDLFSLKDLDQLAPAVNLPLVLSMTCYSGRFDHPTADSLGEKFLRLQGRGAVAVLAASWRVKPFVKFSWALLSKFETQHTIGEAILHAKHQAKSESLVVRYNLLGDPAIELALPEHGLELVARAKGKDAWQVATAVPEEMRTGHAVVDWLDTSGELVHSQQMPVQGKRLKANFRQPNEGSSVASVRVYIWNESAGIDGIGALELSRESG